MDRKRPDGLAAWCRSCRSISAAKHHAKPEVKERRAAIALKWRLENPEAYRTAYRRQNARTDNRDARRRKSAAWEKTDAGKKWRQSWGDANREKKRAHSAVLNAIRGGMLIRPSICPLCGKPPTRAINAHHRDYSKPLEVEWCCEKCHRKIA